jgi:ribosomal protein L15
LFKDIAKSEKYGESLVFAFEGDLEIEEIEENIEKFGKKEKEGYEIILKNYKILGKGEVKDKLKIECLEISKNAKEKIEKAGGTVIIKKKKRIETPLVTFNKK